MAFPNIKEAKGELDEVIKRLHERGVKNVKYDDQIIRGFDYYTGTVFEVFDTSPENNRSLFGGGRYDDLLSLFGGESLPAFGFGMGDVTIRDFLETHKLLPTYKSSTEIMVCIMEESSLSYAEKVATELRAAGKNVAINYSYKSVGDQIKSATKQCVSSVIVIGDEEAKTGTYKIKDLKTGEEQVQ
jgi:histidyl-tRNA synthetase